MITFFQRLRRAGPVSAAPLILAALLASAGFEDLCAQDQLGVITKKLPGRRMRNSSGLFDPESNADSFRIEPGETVVLAELNRGWAVRRGKWPYFEGGRIPLDPWGQKYRYRAPGRYNPNAFDVWSVHGHSRDPSLWIGNWVKKEE